MSVWCRLWNDFRMPFQYMMELILLMEWFYEKFNCIVYVWIFIWSMNFLLMYFKIPYDFTIRVCFAFSVPCQNRDFNNLERKCPGQLARTSTNPTCPEVNDHVSLQWPWGLRDSNWWSLGSKLRLDQLSYTPHGYYYYYYYYY